MTHRSFTRMFTQKLLSGALLASLATPLLSNVAEGAKTQQPQPNEKITLGKGKTSSTIPVFVILPNTTPANSPERKAFPQPIQFVPGNSDCSADFYPVFEKGLHSVTYPLSVNINGAFQPTQQLTCPSAAYRSHLFPSSAGVIGEPAKIIFSTPRASLSNPLSNPSSSPSASVSTTYSIEISTSQQGFASAFICTPHAEPSPVVSPPNTPVIESPAPVKPAPTPVPAAPLTIPAPAATPVPTPVVTQVPQTPPYSSHTPQTKFDGSFGSNSLGGLFAASARHFTSPNGFGLVFGATVTRNSASLSASDVVASVTTLSAGPLAGVSYVFGSHRLSLTGSVGGRSDSFELIAPNQVSLRNARDEAKLLVGGAAAYESTYFDARAELTSDSSLPASVKLRLTPNPYHPFAITASSDTLFQKALVVASSGAMRNASFDSGAVVNLSCLSLTFPLSVSVRPTITAGLESIVNNSTQLGTLVGGAAKVHTTLVRGQFGILYSLDGSLYFSADVDF
ncbi:hypothetical protein HZC07_03025 [Candidatus Micrarchaeota archaeon]|nr:hypothetical protein [Candidatus Micrarchaeota archaeon]